MTDIETLIRRDVNTLITVPPNVRPDWDDVLRRVNPQAETPRRRRGTASRLYVRTRRRPLLTLAVALVVALIPVSALAITGQIPLSDWPFLQNRDLTPNEPYPVKGTGVVVIRSGEWNGDTWVLTAFRSTAGGVCWDMTETTNGLPTPRGAQAGACAMIEGEPKSSTALGASQRRRPQHEPPLSVTYLASLGGVRPHSFPSYIVGPVWGKAVEVIIYLESGTVIHTPAIPAPSSLGSDISFYAVQLQQPASPEKIVGLDHSGRIVACFTRTPGASKQGFPLSACR